MQTTPRPWAIFNDHPDATTAKNMATINRADHVKDGTDIASIYCYAWPEQAANAALIIKAVNAHDDLVAILRRLIAANDVIDAARAVLARLDAQ